MKRVLVTGTGSGLGAAIASVLADEGHRVAGTVRAAGGDVDPRIVALEADMRDRPSLKAAVDRAAEVLGGLDAVVCNAGVQGVSGLDGLADETWDETIAVNLTAPALLSRAALPYLRAAGGGAIVLIGSVHGRATAPARIAYAASKAGLEGLARALAVDLAQDRIRAVAVCPGPFDSPALHEAAARFFPRANPQDAMERFAASQPSGAIGDPTHLGRLIAFLISDAASFVSGASFLMDGGQTARLVTPQRTDP